MKLTSVLLSGIVLSTANAAAIPQPDANANAMADAKLPTTTVTITQSGAEVTHRYGRFNNTHHEGSSTSSSTGTHKFGRFNNTHHEGSSTSSSTGTHKFGKFNNTHHEVTTTTIVEENAANAISSPFTMKNSVIGWSAGAVGCAAAALLL